MWTPRESSLGRSNARREATTSQVPFPGSPSSVISSYSCSTLTSLTSATNSSASLNLSVVMMIRYASSSTRPTKLIHNKYASLYIYTVYVLRCTLTDHILSSQLMRVYGALMWSLGKVLNTPEVMRVYIG